MARHRKSAKRRKTDQAPVSSASSVSQVDSPNAVGQATEEAGRASPESQDSLQCDQTVEESVWDGTFLMAPGRDIPKPPAFEIIGRSERIVLHYTFACVSCQRVMRVYSTTLLLPEAHWANDRFIPMSCATCLGLGKKETDMAIRLKNTVSNEGAAQANATGANLAQQSAQTPTASEGLTPLQLHPQIITSWEIHRVAQRAFGTSLSNNHAHRPVWNIETAWETLRAGEMKMSVPPVLDAESVSLEWDNPYSLRGRVKRYQLLPTIQDGFLPEAATAYVRAAKGKPVGASKWKTVPSDS